MLESLHIVQFASVISQLVEHFIPRQPATFLNRRQPIPSTQSGFGRGG